MIRLVCSFAFFFGLLRDPVFVCVRFRFPAFNVCGLYRFLALYVTRFVCFFTPIFPPSTWSVLYVYSHPFSAFYVIRYIMCAFGSVFPPSTSAVSTVIPPYTWHGSYVCSLPLSRLQRDPFHMYVHIRFRPSTWSGISCVRSLPFFRLQRVLSLPFCRLIRDTVRMCVHLNFPASNVIQFICFIHYRFPALYVTRFVCLFISIFLLSTLSVLYVHPLPFFGLQRDPVRMFVGIRFKPLTWPCLWGLSLPFSAFKCSFATAFRPSSWSGSYVRSLPFSAFYVIRYVFAIASVFQPSTCAFATVFPPYTWHSSRLQHDSLCVCIHSRFPAFNVI